jgi:hypothetical protein
MYYSALAGKTFERQKQPVCAAFPLPCRYLFLMVKNDVKRCLLETFKVTGREGRRQQWGFREVSDMAEGF